MKNCANSYIRIMFVRIKEHSWGFLIFICQDRYMTVSLAFRAICMHEKPRTCFSACQSETVVLNLQSRVRILSPYPFVCPCLHLSYYPYRDNFGRGHGHNCPLIFKMAPSDILK